MNPAKCCYTIEFWNCYQAGSCIFRWYYVYEYRYIYIYISKWYCHPSKTLYFSLYFQVTPARAGGAEPLYTYEKCLLPWSHGEIAVYGAIPARIRANTGKPALFFFTKTGCKGVIWIWKKDKSSRVSPFSPSNKRPKQLSSLPCSSHFKSLLLDETKHPNGSQWSLTLSCIRKKQDVPSNV